MDRLADAIGQAGMVVETSRDIGTMHWKTKSTMAGPHNEVAIAAVGGKIYAVAGSSPANYQLDIIEEYDPVSDRWRKRAPTPSGFNHGSAVVLNGKLYVIGGFTQRQHGGATSFFSNMIRPETRGRAPRN